MKTGHEILVTSLFTTDLCSTALYFPLLNIYPKQKDYNVNTDNIT